MQFLSELAVPFFRSVILKRVLNSIDFGFCALPEEKTTLPCGASNFKLISSPL